jgi:hypothetical protein
MPRSLCVGLDEMLHHPYLERALPSGEKVGACIVAVPDIRPEGFGCVAPEGLFSPDPVLEASDPDAMLFEVDAIYGELGGFVHPQAVVVDQRKEGAVAGGVDRREEAFEFVLGKVFWKGAHSLVI